MDDCTTNNITNKNQCSLNVNNKIESITIMFNMFFNICKYIFDWILENVIILTLAVIFCFIVYVIYKCYFNPVILKRELSEIGFEHIEKGPDRQRRIARVQAARRLGSKIPPPFPNGWFAIAESRHLKKGDVLAVDALGENLCVYRGEDGVARCVDAYCPHLGAHLAVGGTVCGNCIECPFHKWRFDANGACVSVPGLEHAPKGVSVKTWHTVEADGAVWVWHDAENRDPIWMVKDAEELKGWKLRGRNEFYVSAHVQEIPENGADVAHLNAVHSPSLLSDFGEKYPILCDIIVAPSWGGLSPAVDCKWLTSNIKLSHHYKILKCELLHLNVNITQIGPGHVRLLIHSPLGPVLVVQSVTPLGPLLQKVVHRMYSPAYNALFGAFMVFSEAAMVRSNSTYINAPAYVKADKTIRGFRTWFSQFYSENSKTFKDAMQNPLDW
ncbi:hypothetical protein K1T71_000747 [Dendrolimus kikuchii]|uniref:Uncharacterized protein n=1 Tax=Dendrolimus kikuchii TaxID=765133 RepID=A0ACC1DK17_9NEOP|nr:hypothetical protein K1T71_000747 [Dendrolimus kikuchii]